MTSEYFRKTAEALYTLAKAASRADEGLLLVLQAMEFEARAVDVEEGKAPSLSMLSSKVLCEPETT